MTIAVTQVGIVLLIATGVASADPQPDPSSPPIRVGFELGVDAAWTTTGNPYNPTAGGAGPLFALVVGGQLTERFGLYGVLRTPFYFFADHLPGLGISIDWFDFNALVLSIAVRRFTLSVGPSLDILLPTQGNYAVGGGADLRVDYELVRQTADKGQARITLGLLVHPSAMHFTEAHGYFSFLKTVVVVGLSAGAQWH